MDKLLSYLNSLDIGSQARFATRCQTTVGYLRKACSVKQQLSDGLCLRITAESAGIVQPEHLRPDVDWQYLRSALANSAQIATETIAGVGKHHDANHDPAICVCVADCQAAGQGGHIG